MIPLLRKRGKVFLLALVVLIVLEIVGKTLFKQKTNDWKSFTGKDSDFGVQTTISLPPGCDFVFSGSEWDLHCGENESGIIRILSIEEMMSRIQKTITPASLYNSGTVVYKSG